MFESVSDDVAEDLRRNLVELLAGSIVIVEIRERVAITSYRRIKQTKMRAHLASAWSDR
jgi:hypothetical protein